MMVFHQQFFSVSVAMFSNKNNIFVFYVGKIFFMLTEFCKVLYIHIQINFGNIVVFRFKHGINEKT